MPSSLAVYEMEDHVSVAVTSLITKGTSEGPVGMFVLGEEGGFGDCSTISYKTRVVSQTVCSDFSRLD